ncbi:MAG TPA: hypothetical protein DCX07_15165 [Phycisphaerales bacterium]|nr:hypothetical protein [Phycisphaerales bacterium]
MLRKLLTRACWIGVLFAGLSLSQAAPPSLDIPPEALESGLLPMHVAKVRARVEYWAQALADAKTPEAIVAARQGMVQDYRGLESLSFKYHYANETAKAVVKRLGTFGDELKALRDVNLALAARQMPQVPVQAALDKMASSSNPAVRYLAWQGYGQVKMLVLAQGESFATKMLATFKERAQAEDSPLVCGEIFSTLYLPSVSTVMIEKGVLAKAQAVSVETFRAVWPGICQGALDGDAKKMDAVRKGLIALSLMGQDGGYKDSVKDADGLAQMALDGLWCAGKVLDRSKGQGEIVNDCVQTLREGERALNAATGKGKTHVEAALADTKDRGAAVLLAVLKWVDELKKDYGVSEPKLQASPTTAPASQPDK